MNAWYAELNRPPLTPPDWIFGPVWTVLYLMILVAVIAYYRAANKPHVLRTTLVLIIHLALNFAWTWLFFGLRAPLLALIDMVLLDLSLLLLLRWFRQSSNFAAYLLVPYLIWILFASYLNAGFYWLN